MFGWLFRLFGKSSMTPTHQQTKMMARGREVVRKTRSGSKNRW